VSFPVCLGAVPEDVRVRALAAGRADEDAVSLVPTSRPWAPGCPACPAARRPAGGCEGTYGSARRSARATELPVVSRVL